MKYYLLDRVKKSNDGLYHPERGANCRWGNVVIYYDNKYQNCIMELNIISEDELSKLGLDYSDIEGDINDFISDREITEEEYDLLRRYYTK